MPRILSINCRKSHASQETSRTISVFNDSLFAFGSSIEHSFRIAKFTSHPPPLPPWFPRNSIETHPPQR